MAKIKKTAAELLAELHNDSTYKLMAEKKQEERKATQELLAKDEQIITNKLKDIGININSIYDLVNSQKPYTNAIPVLIELLEKGQLKQNQTIEGVIRALAVEDAKGIANKSLLELYFNSFEQNPPYRWAIGNTMEVIMTDDDIEEIIKIVSTPENGISRQMFVSALGKIKSEKSEQVLISLLEDEQVRIHAIDALGKMKSYRAKLKISEIANSSKGSLKKEAIKALKKIG